MTKAERYRFVKLIAGVADTVGQYNTGTHVQLAKNYFAAQMNEPDFPTSHEVFLIECPGFTRKSVTAMQQLLGHLLQEPETALSLRLHLIAVEIEEEENGTILIDTYFVVMTNDSIYVCLGGCSYHTGGYQGSEILETLFVSLARTCGTIIARHHIPLEQGCSITQALSDYYDEIYESRRQQQR